MTFEINDSSITMTTLLPDGGKQIKMIDPDEFTTAMARQSRIETGLLPANTRYYASNGQLTSIVLEAKPQIRKLSVHHDIISVPIPATLMMITVNNLPNGLKDVSGTYLYSYSDIMLAETTRLKYFPYGNVYTDGRICWGSIHIPRTVKELYQLSGLLDLFLGTEFNGDLSGNIVPFDVLKDGGKLHITNGIGVARYLADSGATIFDNKILSDSSLTFAKLVNHSH